MGNSSSSNTIDNFVSSCIDIYNNSVQNCGTKISQKQGIYIDGVKGDVKLSDIDWTQYLSVSTACLQQATVDNQATQDITTAIAQSATTISQALSLNPGSTDSTNITRLTEELATNIKNSFSQGCAINAVQEQTITVRNVDGSVYLNAVKWKETAETITKCVQATAASTAAYQSLSQALSQTAKSEQKGILDFLGNWAALVVVAIAIIAIMFSFTISRALSPNFIVMIMVLAFIIITIGRWMYMKPFYKKEETVPGYIADQCSPADAAYGCHTRTDQTYLAKVNEANANNKVISRRNTMVQIGFAIATIVTIIFAIFMNGSEQKSKVESPIVPKN
jgi:hypothetical protein